MFNYANQNQNQNQTHSFTFPAPNHSHPMICYPPSYPHCSSYPSVGINHALRHPPTATVYSCAPYQPGVPAVDTMSRFNHGFIPPPPMQPPPSFINTHYEGYNIHQQYPLSQSLISPCNSTQVKDIHPRPRYVALMYKISFN